MSDEILSEVESQEEVILESVDDYYSFLRTMVESLESDALKVSRGNKAAGVRLRKSLRLIKGHTGDFVKFTLQK